MKAFAISHASCSLIPSLFVPPARLKNLRESNPGEALEMFRYSCYLPCIESRAELTPPPRPHLAGTTGCTPQHGPHLSSGAFLHKAHHSGWYGPHLPLEALMHSLPAFQSLPARSPFPTYSPDCPCPQDIHGNFLQQCHVRKVSKAFEAKMPGKQRGKFTPPHTPRLL